jgi:hypothetical protein
MTQTQASAFDDNFHRVRFIMVQPSHPGNVGAAARAIKTMGFGDLCLVDPLDPDVAQNPQAISLASGAVDVLEQATIVPTLAHALEPVTLHDGDARVQPKQALILARGAVATAMAAVLDQTMIDQGGQQPVDGGAL